ncbi:hypothetical protein HGA34_02170 [Candidatus Falkowbacteria bacterium]|nr:hypothetical protein [Candidatus Falkowbacteria bacterium]
MSLGIKEEEPKPEMVTEQLKRISEKIKAKLEALSRPKRSEGVLATDLIKSEVITFFDWQRNLTLLATFLAIDFIIIFAGYRGVEWWQAQKQKEIESVIQQFNLLDMEKKREEVDLDKIIDLQRKLDQVTFLLNRHIRWTSFFKFLEENTLSNVYFDSFGGSINGSYSLKGHADSFYSVAHQIDVLRHNPKVISVEVSGGSVDPVSKSVNFDLGLVIKSDVFLEKK